MERGNDLPIKERKIRKPGHVSIPIASLLRQGMSEIRTMAASGHVIELEDGADPNSAYNFDHVTRIRMIADICQDFGTALMAETRHEREHLAAAALSYRWKAAIPEAQLWIRSRLAQLGDGYIDLVENNAGTRR